MFEVVRRKFDLKFGGLELITLMHAAVKQQVVL